MSLAAYLPQDRRHELARGQALPEHTTGTALFADLSGFTPLTEALAQTLGPRRGGEALTHQLNDVYDSLIAAVDRYGGSVIGFAGDSISCWFDDRLEIDAAANQSPITHPQSAGALRASTCALAMQQTMQPFAAIPL